MCNYNQSHLVVNEINFKNTIISTIIVNCFVESRTGRHIKENNRSFVIGILVFLTLNVIK